MLDFNHERFSPAPNSAAPSRFKKALVSPFASSRDERVASIKAQVARGDYLTDTKLDGALDILLNQELASKRSSC